MRPPVSLPTSDRVTGDGRGPVRVGASYAELAREIGRTVEVNVLGDDPGADFETEPCTYVTVGGDDVNLVVGGAGRVRAVVFGAPGILSKSGVGVGSTEAEVLGTYGSASRVPNTYGSVEDVLVPAGAGRSLRFEFDEDRRVCRMHAGETDYALLVEGCA